MSEGPTKQEARRSKHGQGKEGRKEGRKTVLGMTLVLTARRASIGTCGQMKTEECRQTIKISDGMPWCTSCTAWPGRCMHGWRSWQCPVAAEKNELNTTCSSRGLACWSGPAGPVAWHWGARAPAGAAAVVAGFKVIFGAGALLRGRTIVANEFRSRLHFRAWPLSRHTTPDVPPCHCH